MTADKLEETVDLGIELVEKIFSSEPSAEDIQGIIGVGTDIANSSGLIAKTLVQAQELLKMKELHFMNTNQGLWNTPTVLKKLMEGNLAKYYAKVLLMDRYSAAAVHRLEFYRSIISKYKEELKLQ